MTPAADDFDTIHRRLRAIAGERSGICPKWADPHFSSQNCWCFGGGPNGETLRCPVKPAEEGQ